MMSHWLRLVAASAAVVLLSACGGSAAPPPTAEPAAAPSVAPTVARAAASPSPSATVASPTATSAPAASAATVYVGNTDGEGVYVRKTPVMADRAQAYTDGTALTIVGDDVDGDGQHWKHIKTPDGLEGYVPSIYTVSTPP